MSFFIFNTPYFTDLIFSLVGFLNDLMDTRHAIITRSVWFNIMGCPVFLDFIDPDIIHREPLAIAYEEQDEKIKNLIINFSQ